MSINLSSNENSLAHDNGLNDLRNPSPVGSHHTPDGHNHYHLDSYVGNQFQNAPNNSNKVFSDPIDTVEFDMDENYMDLCVANNPNTNSVNNSNVNSPDTNRSTSVNSSHNNNNSNGLLMYQKPDYINLKHRLMERAYSDNLASNSNTSQHSHSHSVMNSMQGHGANSIAGTIMNSNLNINGSPDMTCNGRSPSMMSHNDGSPGIINGDIHTQRLLNGSDIGSPSTVVNADSSSIGASPNPDDRSMINMNQSNSFVVLTDQDLQQNNDLSATHRYYPKGGSRKSVYVMKSNENSENNDVFSDISLPNHQHVINEDFQNLSNSGKASISVIPEQAMINIKTPRNLTISNFNDQTLNLQNSFISESDRLSMNNTMRQSISSISSNNNKQHTIFTVSPFKSSKAETIRKAPLTLQNYVDNVDQFTASPNDLGHDSNSLENSSVNVLQSQDLQQQLNLPNGFQINDRNSFKYNICDTLNEKDLINADKNDDNNYQKQQQIYIPSSNYQLKNNLNISTNSVTFSQNSLSYGVQSNEHPRQMQPQKLKTMDSYR